MAGIFDTTDLGEAQASPISVKEGIESPATPGVLGALASISSMAADIITDAASKKGKEKDYSPVSSFALDIADLTDAVSRGEIDPKEANTKIRARRNYYIANNPGVDPKDFFNIQQEAATSDKVLETGSEQYMDEQVIRKRAKDGGYLMPGMDVRDEQFQISNMLEQEALKRQMDENLKMMEYESKQVGLDTAKRTNRMARLEENSKTILTQSLSNQRESLERQASTILARTRLPASSPNYLDGEQAAVALSQLRYGLESFASEVAPYAGGDFIGLQTKPMVEYLTNMTEVVKGTTKKEVLDNKLQNDLKTLQIQMKTDDPRLARLAAYDALWKNAQVSIAQEVSEKALAIHMQASNGQEVTGTLIPELTNAANARDVKDYLQLLRGHMRRFKTGEMTPEETQQLDNQHTSILKTIGESPNSRIQDLMPVVNYLAGPEFREYVKKRGGVPADISSAKLVLDRQYREQLLPVLQEELLNKKVILAGADMKAGGKITYQDDITKYVTANMRGGTVSFERVMDPRDPITKARVDSIVKDMNKELAPHLTRLSNLSANLNNTSPESEWKSISERILPVAPEDKKKGKIERTATPEPTPNLPSPTQGLTEEELSATPEIHPEDAAWVRAAATLEEKKRRAQRIGVPLDMIEQATRGR